MIIGFIDVLGGWAPCGGFFPGPAISALTQVDGEKFFFFFIAMSIWES
ncbi:MAG: hypothetical protein CM15mP70_11100 [Pelagibacteraceae bacterium]|nr:MAG: hypothetical protein CM15mP70_11100 [Pelagibacteraceae bacterium]